MAREAPTGLLGDKGKNPVALGGNGTFGRRRPKPENKRIAARVAEFCIRHVGRLADTGVQPLNAGFFQLEALRHANVAGKKARKVKRRKPK